ncbi:lipid II:glycine glycyltransferase FemX [Halobacillus faecis]
MDSYIYKGKDSELWHEYLNQMRNKDIYFTPEYLTLHELNGEGEATLFLYVEGNEFIYYPFLKRKLSELPHLSLNSNLSGELYDITTPYGYGGPISNIKDASRKNQFYKNFTKAFENYCEKEGIVTEFVRFHPLIGNHQDYLSIDSTYLRNTIHVDLTKDLDEIWANYDSTNRNRIRKANKNGLEVIHKPLHQRKDFLRIYYATMDKNNASQYYYFSEQYFQNKAELLEEKAELFEVRYRGQIIFSGIFMRYGDFLHYDLVGSDLNYLKICPNNYVIDYAARWGKERGMKYLHLGGGYSGNDNLFRFKKRFNKYGELPFYIGKKVHNNNIYQKLTERMDSGSGYFPMYRDTSILEKKETVVG